MNYLEADGVVTIMEYALANGLKANQLAVVTPFRRQAAEIRRKLLEKIKIDNIPIIDTVERVQGISVEMIIISMTASDPDYISSVGDFLDFLQEDLYVLISRAKTKVIIFCSNELFKHNAQIQLKLSED